MLGMYARQYGFHQLAPPSTRFRRSSTLPSQQKKENTYPAALFDDLAFNSVGWDNALDAMRYNFWLSAYEQNMLVDYLNIRFIYETEDDS